MVDRPRRRRRWLVIALVVLLALVAAVAIPAYAFFQKDEPEVHANIEEQFKYGSIGSEARLGVPYYVWAVLPDVFPDLLPDHPGTGWERFGFIQEPGHPRPIGFSFRKKPVGLVGANCAACHVGTVRAAPGAPRQIVLGMPANVVSLDEYVTFLRAAGKDPRFDADTLMSAIERRFDLSRSEKLLYRYLVIPETKKGLDELEDEFRWRDTRPAVGPGRVDTFNPWKYRLGLLDDRDKTIGTVDFPQIWNQRDRIGLWLHWDGNNNSLTERNLSATLAAGAKEDSIDFDSLNRIAAYLLTLKPPAYPAARIDRALAARGRVIYEQQCATCHDLGGPRVGQVTPIAEVGTDRARLDSFTPALANALNTEVGKGESWDFSHFRKTHGYANQPLDGLWLRAPYLHNGSVPTLRALLFPDERPAVFWTGYDVYDWKNVGFVSSGAEAERVGFRYDTRVRGNGNGGHMYGTDLPPAQRLALIEYLKTK
jgi:mono/diheme cytochrome c family protein